jgi:predicted lipoprotein with Yx(FWY)xxD motif
VLAALLAVLAAALAGCGHASRRRSGDRLLELPVPTQVTVRVGHLAGLGALLVDGRGRTLYMFPPDAGSKVTCTGPCAGTWPPLVIGTGQRPTAGAGVNAADLGTLADPNTGARIITYGGYPLYRYAGDMQSGTANGQGLFLNGGPWYALTPRMQPITITPGGG